MVMVCFVNAEEEEDKADRYVGAAFLGSAHEDLLQMPRRGAASRKAHTLDPCPDDPRESLFTLEKEKKMIGRGRQGGGVGSNSTANRDSKGGRGRKGDDRQGKGKGKGSRGRRRGSGCGRQGKN